MYRSRAEVSLFCSVLTGYRRSRSADKSDGREWQAVPDIQLKTFLLFLFPVILVVKLFPFHWLTRYSSQFTPSLLIALALLLTNSLSLSRETTTALLEGHTTTTSGNSVSPLIDIQFENEIHIEFYEMNSCIKSRVQTHSWFFSLSLHHIFDRKRRSSTKTRYSRIILFFFSPFKKLLKKSWSLE